MLGGVREEPCSESGENVSTSGLRVGWELGVAGSILLDLFDVRLDLVPSGENASRGDK